MSLLNPKIFFFTQVKTAKTYCSPDRQKPGNTKRLPLLGPARAGTNLLETKGSFTKLSCTQASGTDARESPVPQDGSQLFREMGSTAEFVPSPPSERGCRAPAAVPGVSPKFKNRCLQKHLDNFSCLDHMCIHTVQGTRHCQLAAAH